LTDNAVRAHLATLERDGLVRQAGLRRGTSKPAYAYALTPAAERLFPKAYGTLLRMLLDVLSERLPPSAVDDAVREVGHRVAAGQTVPNGELRDRVDQALAVLGELGGLAEAEEREDGLSSGAPAAPRGGASRPSRDLSSGRNATQ
jgi:predicted ArsR family transcriptional regulator